MLKFENPNNGRYYYIFKERDLLNDLVLTVIRGGNNTHVRRSIGFDCELAIHKEICRLSKKRIKRGYILVT